jgi:hypothetical protein
MFTVAFSVTFSSLSHNTEDSKFSKDVTTALLSIGYCFCQRVTVVHRNGSCSQTGSNPSALDVVYVVRKSMKPYTGRFLMICNKYNDRVPLLKSRQEDAVKIWSQQPPFDYFRVNYALQMAPQVEFGRCGIRQSGRLQNSVRFVPSIWIVRVIQKLFYVVGKMSRSSILINHTICRVVLQYLRYTPNSSVKNVNRRALRLAAIARKVLWGDRKY